MYPDDPYVYPPVSASQLTGYWTLRDALYSRFGSLQPDDVAGVLTRRRLEVDLLPLEERDRATAALDAWRPPMNRL